MKRPSVRGAATALAAAAGAIVVAILGQLCGLGLVITHGTSMAPRFRTGDLAITYRAGAYHPGDIVAYRSATLSTTVLHRIVRSEGGHFVTQGDNNSWIDPDRPSTSEVTGRLLLHIPYVGRLAALVRSPIAVATWAALGLLVAVSWVRRRNPRRQTVRAESSGDRTAGRRRQAIAALAALALLAVLSVGAIWAAPYAGTTGAPTTASAGAGPSSGRAERIAIEYSAKTSAVVAYANGTVSTGDPIFVKAVTALAVTAVYTGQPGAQLDLTAEVGHPSGWHRAFPLSNRTSTQTTTGVTANATVDIAAVVAMLKQFADETGLPAPGCVLALVAATKSWSTRAELTYDGVQLVATTKAFDATRTVAASPSSAASGRSNAWSTGRLLAPLGRALPDAQLRAEATLGILLLIVVGMITAVGRLRRASDVQPTDQLLPVAETTPAAAKTVVNLLSPAELARTADRASLQIFQTTIADGQAPPLDDDDEVLHQLPEPKLSA